MSSLEVTVTSLSTIQQPSTANVFLKGVFSSDKMFLQYFVFCRSAYEVMGVDDGGPNINLNFLLRICWLVKR